MEWGYALLCSGYSCPLGGYENKIRGEGLSEALKG